jgi:3-hydroxyisobutyrate dehydrogenase-like beta-hydroxyacid dehydrogenase
MEVGFLHPGLMGETLAANCSETALWVGQGRSADTRARAEHHGLTEVATLRELVDRAGAIVSICPPGAALEVATTVADADFTELYVDANAVSPDTARSIATRFEHYVDGSVIGPPAHTPGTTRLYLSGERATEVAGWYGGSALDARVIGLEPGAASALKMAYASWTKIGSAMNLAIRALARAEGIDDALVDEWNISQPGLVDRSDRVAAGVSPRAWRFTGEMQQIADSFVAAGLPPGFAEAAHEVYRRMAGLKGASDVTLDRVIDQLNADES